MADSRSDTSLPNGGHHYPTWTAETLGGVVVALPPLPDWHAFESVTLS